MKLILYIFLLYHHYKCYDRGFHMYRNIILLEISILYTFFMDTLYFFLLYTFFCVLLDFVTKLIYSNEDNFMLWFS